MYILFQILRERIINQPGKYVLWEKETHDFNLNRFTKLKNTWKRRIGKNAWLHDCMVA